MGRRTNYELDFYKQFEELNKKMDCLLKENKELNNTNKELYKKLDEANKLNEKLKNEIDRLKNKNNKNSTNSSKPSSTNFTTPKKKTGANLYNYRVKTDNKIGGQYGHDGHNLSKKQIEDLINKKKIEVRTIYHKINEKDNNEKHIFNCGRNCKEKLPKEFYTDVTYDNSIKSLSIELGAYNVVSYDRLSDFFSVITNDVITLSNGTLVNFLYDFSDKSEDTIKNLEQDILNDKNTFTDETGTKFNKKNMFIRNYSNENTVVYKAHKNKGHKPIIEDNILPNFYDGIMGNHDTTLYSYGTKNYECNIHLGRYLEELIQNVPNIKWAFEMKNLIFRMNNTKKLAIQYGLKKFDKNKIKEYETEYDEILKIAKEENKHISSSFYKSKANKLYNRLRKYKKNHFYFVKDFKVSFDNNLSEQDLRMFKTKTKISGGFRSMKGAKSFVNALSIIKTSLKRNINPYESIQKIFNNEILFA